MRIHVDPATRLALESNSELATTHCGGVQIGGSYGHSHIDRSTFRPIHEYLIATINNANYWKINSDRKACQNICKR